MKSKRAFLAIGITALVLTIILISIRAYYVAVSLFAGTLLIGYREFWSLLTKRRLPPFDERVRENVSKSVRNGFIFFASALVFLMLPFSTFLIKEPDVVHLLGGLLVSGGAIYLLSYLFYDRVEPKLDARERKTLKTFLALAGISLAVFILGVFLHNALSGLFRIEEPVFFVIATIIAPLSFAVGLIGSLVFSIKGRFYKAP